MSFSFYLINAPFVLRELMIIIVKFYISLWKQFL